MYEKYKIYGPYKAKDGRLRIIGVDENGNKHTISYPKFLMENHLNRYLEKDEQIDHIDGNPLNNDISNLQILKLGEHQKLDALRVKNVKVRCAYCGKEFIIKGSNLCLRNRKDRLQTGYFCSRECSGKYGKEIQLGKRIPSVTENVVSTKYKVKSALMRNPNVEAG